MKKNIFFLKGNNDLYNKALAESIMDELKESYSEIECRYLSVLKDIFRANAIVICGEGDFPRKKVWGISILKKPLVLYHVSVNANGFQKFAKSRSWIVTSRKGEAPPFSEKGRGEVDCDYYPSPVFLSDLATPKRIGRIWRREKLVSKRGCIGIIGLSLDESLQKKLAAVLDLLVEDLDLNIIFIPVLQSDSALMQDVLSQIKFSANTRQIRTEMYSCAELLGIISKVDILITSDKRGAICAMASNRPIIALRADEPLSELLSGVVQEDILLDIGELSSDEIYTKIKIAWVHRDAIIEQMQGRINELKLGASEGVRQLGKRVFKGFS